MARMKLRNTMMLVAALVVAPAAAQAQVGTFSNIESIDLAATRDASITIGVSTNTLTMASAIVDNSTANSFGGLTISTDYSVNAGTNVVLYGYFGSATSALVSGTNSIPSSWVEGSTDGVTFAPFSGMALTGGGSWGVDNATLVLRNIAIPAGGAAGSVSTNLDLRLNTTGRQVVAGNYAGQLQLRAVVQ